LTTPLSLLQKSTASLPAEIKTKWWHGSSHLEALRQPLKLLSKDKKDPKKCYDEKGYQGIIIDDKGRGPSLNYTHLSKR
jgi:hypothetical protein